MTELEIKDVVKSVEAVNTAFEAFKEANDKRLDDMATKGSVDVLIDEKLNRINDEMDKHSKTLEQFQASMKRKSTTIKDQDGNDVDLDAKASGWARDMAYLRKQAPEPFDNAGMGEYRKAFEKFLRKGGDNAMLSDMERKALSVGSDPDGGYVVHPDMSGRIVKQVYESSPIRQYASVQAISTDALEGLHDLGEAAAGWVSETGARTETSTPQIKKWSIVAHEMYANPKATQKILDDASIDMEAWLSGKVAEKFARVESTAFVTGNGVDKPRGFLTYASGTTNPGTIEQFNTGANGAFVAAPNGGDVLINALYGLKAQYRANAVWAMNRTTTRDVRKLKDSDGAYLWAAGITGGQPATVLGYPTASFEDMPALATGSLSIAVADWREAYQIVDRIGIRVLRDPYSDKPYVGLYSTKRVGGDVVNFEAIKLVNFTA